MNPVLPVATAAAVVIAPMVGLLFVAGGSMATQPAACGTSAASQRPFADDSAPTASRSSATRTLVSSSAGPVTPAPAAPTPDTPGTSDAVSACVVADVPPDAVAGLLSFAAAQVGNAYVLGAIGPDAWDCSALVQAAYATAGVTLPRTADEQYDDARAHGQVFDGPPAVAMLQPGDLLFSPGDDPVRAVDGQLIGHVALYAGNGVVIEAKGAEWGVISATYTATDFGRVTFTGRLVPTPLAMPVPSGFLTSPDIAPAPASPPEGTS
jgi:cell wall-associated NlpC family hydrolase